MNEGKCLTPFQHRLLLKNLDKPELRAEYRQRIEIMLLADAGRSQAQICEALGCAQETARYWMVMAQSGQAHQWDDRLMGRPKKVDERYLQRLKELVGHSPKDYGYAFHRWTGQWLAKHLAKELEIEISGCHVNRLLKQMGLSTRLRTSTGGAVESANHSTLVICDLSSTTAFETSQPWQFPSIG